MSAPIRYLITYDPAGQVRLSKLGHWGNIPHGSEEEAEEAARQDASGKPFKLARRVLQPLPPFRATQYTG